MFVQSTFLAYKYVCAYRSTSANFARNTLIAHTDSARNLHGCAPTEAWLPADNLLNTPWKKLFVLCTWFDLRMGSFLYILHYSYIMHYHDIDLSG